MSGERRRKPRPYWHVDAKWIAGLLLLSVLGLGQLLFNLAQVTAERPAVETVSKVLALSFSPKGLDDETEIAQFGRIGSPGVLLFLASLPGAVVSTAAYLSMRKATVAVPGEEAGISEIARYFAINVLPPLLQICSRIHLLAAVAGLGLITLAVGGSIIAALTRKKPAPFGQWPGSEVR